MLKRSDVRPLKEILDVLEAATVVCFEHADPREQYKAVLVSATKLRAFLKPYIRPVGIPKPIYHTERPTYPTTAGEVFPGENRDARHQIPGYPDYYASPLGRIWSYKSGRWLKAAGPRPSVQLMARGFSHTISVARLVLTTHGGLSCGRSVGYRDGGASNVKLENLYWISP